MPQASLIDLVCPGLDMMRSSRSVLVKYPRTIHLPWSGGVGSDDIITENVTEFIGKNVVVTVKMDGENTTMYSDYIHARSLDSDHHPSRNWVKQLHATIGHMIPEGWRVCGENLFALHTIPYRDLPSYFFVHSIWNERNECLSWDDTCEWAQLLDLAVVPLLYRGPWDEKIVRALYRPEIGGNPCEGYVVRLEGAFPYEEFQRSVAKYVSEKFRHDLDASDNHWRSRPVVPNLLAGDDERESR